jgi:acyl carrier protein
LNASATESACARFQATGEETDFNSAVCGVIQHYLDKPPVMDVAAMPGSTRLVADLGLDSLTMVEMVFLFEDLFGAEIPQDELVKISTLDELKALLRASLAKRPPAQT